MNNQRVKNVLLHVWQTLVLAVCLGVFFLALAVEIQAKDEVKYVFNNAKYLETYDGDTFYVDIPSLHPVFGKRLGVRVREIDTPEMRSSNKYEKMMARRAKAFTEELMSKGKQLRLTECERGTFSRIVCRVSNSLTPDLGKALIDAKLAEPYEE